MTTMRILVANSSEAHLYETPKSKLLNGNPSVTHLKDFSHPESRLKSHDLITDGPGRHETAKAGSGTFVESADPHEHEIEKFARELVDDLNQQFQNNEFHQLIVTASEPFHGVLNKYLKNKLSHVDITNIYKNYTQLNAEDLAKMLPKFL